MARSILATAAVALGAMLAASSSARAGDTTPNPTGFSGGAASGTTMTLGGQGTAAQAASAEDIELMRGGGGRGGGGGGRGGAHASYGGARGVSGGYARGYGGGYGGYGRGYGYGGYGRGYGYGGYGRGYGYGGWGWGGGLYGGYYGGYWPYWPYYYPNYGYGYGLGGYYGINGTADDAATPATYLGTAVTQNAAGTTQRLNDAPATQLVGGLRYDGGPTNPVPYQKADSGQGSSTIPLGTALPVSLRKAQSSSPYSFKAYGEK